MCVYFDWLNSLIDNTNHQQIQHSCRHCTSPCLHRSNPPFLPVPSLLSSASSSNSSSSSPSSPSQIYLKTQSTINCNGTNDDLTRTSNESLSKFISPSLSIITTKDNFQNTKYSSITSSCSTMVTPTASLLSSVTTNTTTLTPSNLFPGKSFDQKERNFLFYSFSFRSSTFIRPMYKTSLSTDIIMESTIIFIIRCIKYCYNIYR